MTLRDRLRRDREGGWAMATAMMVLALMGGIGASTYAVVNVQQEQSGIERTRESSFNLAEGLMNAQILKLSRNWPGGEGGVAPAASKIYGTCTQATAADARCPTAADISNLFRNFDTAGPVTWQTSVHDNPGDWQSFYDDTQTRLQPGWDGTDGVDDGRLWVRAQATVRGRPRTLVALIGVQKVLEELPRVALVAGSIAITNNGNKVMVDANGDTNSYAPGTVAVRCDLAQPGCLSSGRPQAQFEPYDVQGNYSPAPMMSTEQQSRMRDRAISDNTYYTSCAEVQAKGLAGAVVFVELTSDEVCSFGGNQTWNTPDDPGMLIWNRGSLTFGGTVNYYGLLYHLNTSNVNTTVLKTGGNAQIWGGVMVDGMGRVEVGSSKKNIVFDERAHKNVRSYGTAGVVQNTWREIRPAP